MLSGLLCGMAGLLQGARAMAATAKFGEVLTLRVTSNGPESWSLFYNNGGRLRRNTIGNYPAFDPAAARGRSFALHRLAERIDPGEEKAWPVDFRRDLTLHGSATTTAAVRRTIQCSQESLRGLAKRKGVNPKTVAKWSFCWRLRQGSNLRPAA
jgi:hypothetical protein